MIKILDNLQSIAAGTGSENIVFMWGNVVSKKKHAKDIFLQNNREFFKNVAPINIFERLSAFWKFLGILLTFLIECPPYSNELTLTVQDGENFV